MVTRSIDALLAEARQHIERLSPHAASQRAADGALLIDIRPAQQRREHGSLPQALCIERNVPEWRLDPSSPHRIAQVTDHERCVIVVCQQGYASSLAAASLRALGYVHAADLDGGFDAWEAAGLPVELVG